MQSIVDLKSEIKWINKEGVKYKEINNFLLLEWTCPLNTEITDIIQETETMVAISMTV